MQPVFEARLFEHTFIIGSGLWRCLHHCTCVCFVIGCNLIVPAIKAELEVEVGKLIAIGFDMVEFADTNPGLAIELDGRQLVRHGQKFQRFAQVLTDFTLEFIRIRDYAIEVTILRNPLGRCLWPYFRYAGNIIRGITHECEVINNLVRAHLEFFDHGGFVHVMIIHGVDQADVGIDQLRHVLVSGGNQHLIALFDGFPAHGADNVVRLHSFNADQRQAARPDNRVQWFDLLAQVVRHGRAICLVLRVDVVAEGLALGIEDHANLVGLLILDQLAQHVEYEINDLGRFLIGAPQIRTGHVVGTKQVRAAVNQQQFFLIILIHLLTDALKCPTLNPDDITAAAAQRRLALFHWRELCLFTLLSKPSNCRNF